MSLDLSSASLADSDHQDVVTADDVSAAAVRRLIEGRREREKLFPAGLFADPAWDMLLTLYAAHLEGGVVTMTTLCDAAAVPPTTALRWSGNLETAGMIVREEVPKDRRKVHLVLTLEARKALRAYFKRFPAGA